VKTTIDQTLEVVSSSQAQAPLWPAEGPQTENTYPGIGLAKKALESLSSDVSRLGRDTEGKPK
jgi:hypothetical protein